MEEAEALAGSYWAPKRKQLMDSNFLFSGSFGHCGFSNNICSLQGNNQTAQTVFRICKKICILKCFVSINIGLKPKEDESLQMDTMQDEDIAKLLDWGTESKEISDGQFSVLTTKDNLVLDDHQFALLFQVDDDDNNNNKNLTISSCSWDNVPEISARERLKINENVLDSTIIIPVKYVVTKAI